MKLVCAVCLSEFDGTKDGEECPVCCSCQTKEKNKKGGDENC
ncbi:MAG: hypothetical protein PHV77_03245 [Candidatus Omnitrophica bacterium]|jgi:hypothetical protein|nr:hypothetical protein [Candidatus Omnitrophota bacterium]